MVDATPISGPACIGIHPEDIRIACEPITFTILQRVAPLSWASVIAPSVSAVSPLWLMASTTVRSSTIGLEYRNSEAILTSTGMRASSSIRVFPTMPACAAVPHAVITIRSIFFAWDFDIVKSGNVTLPDLKSMRPPMVSVIARTCSWISFCMKCR